MNRPSVFPFLPEMHHLSGGYGLLPTGYPEMAHPSPGGSPHDNAGGGVEDEGAAPPGQQQPQYSDINHILGQILNITEQSLDEAQAGWLSDGAFEKGIRVECFLFASSSKTPAMSSWPPSPICL